MQSPFVRYSLFIAMFVTVGLPAIDGLAADADVVLHVATTGDDAADGSAGRPLKTPHAAQRLVRERLANGALTVRVEIAAGTYSLNEPLVFTPEDAGKFPDRRVTFASVGGDVRISGGTPISGWRRESNQWVAKIPAGLPAFRDLWINGRRAIRARSPNDGYFRVEAAGPDNRTAFTVAASDLLSLAKPTSVEVVFLHDWSVSRIGLAEIDGASRTYRFRDPIGAGSPHFAISQFEPHPRYFVENARELLDAPGEWLLDTAAGEVRYIPREGEQSESAEVVAPRLEKLLIVQGEPDRPVARLNFTGLTFCHTHVELPPHGYAGIQSAFHERRREPDDRQSVSMVAAISADAARDCQFTACRFEQLGGCGLHLQRCGNVIIDQSIFNDISGDGLLIGSAAEVLPVAQGNTVTNCLFQHCGASFFGAVGLWIGYAKDSVIRHNELRSLPYTGISVGWVWAPNPVVSTGHQILENHIHHVMQVLSDGGGIYTLGRQPGTTLARNVIHDVPLNAGRAESNGMFIDEGSTDLVIEGNTIYNIDRSPIRFHRAGNNKIVANRLVAPPGTPTFRYNTTDPAVMTMIDNEEIVATGWQPPPNDPIVEQAGPRTLR